ncbi:MAG: hypothetical protein KH331_06395 [Subdoligranulum variabile]|nr:hypothetical protein [Subdoligranulum variabile]
MLKKAAFFLKKSLDISSASRYNNTRRQGHGPRRKEYADVAELADALDSGSSSLRFLNTVLQCCPTIFGRFAHPEAHFLCHFLEFGRGVGNFFEKKQNKSCCFQNVFNFPVAIPEPGSFDRRAHQRPDEPDDP